MHRLAQVASEFDRTGRSDLADMVDQYMMRLAQQNTTWQNIGDWAQNQAEGALNGLKWLGDAAYQTTPMAQAQNLWTWSTATLEQAFNTAVDEKVKTQLAKELRRRGIDPNSSSVNTAPLAKPTSTTPMPAKQEESDASNRDRVKDEYMGYGYQLLQKMSYQEALRELWSSLSSHQSPEFANEVIQAFKNHYQNQVAIKNQSQ